MAQFARSGAAWKVDLSHQDVVNLSVAATLAPIPEPAVKAAILATAGLIQSVDELGGGHGVTITGIIGAPGVVVTPPGMSPFGDLQHAGNDIAAAGGAISDAWKHVGGELSQQWHSALGGAGDVFGHIFGRGHQDHTPGGVTADRAVAKEWETFVPFAFSGGQLALLSWQGYFSAQPDGSVYANRGEVQGWERWSLTRNGDGTLSLRSTQFGKYFTAEEGGGSVCNANRAAIGAWEKFRLHFVTGGIALSAINGDFVSVQP